MNDKKQVKIFKPFGPPIGQFEMEIDLVNEINNYVDKLIKDNKKALELDAGKQLAGQVNQEINFEKNFSDKIIAPILTKNIEAYIFFSTKKKISQCIFKNIWVVRQFRDEYNPVHYHSGHLSGVGYLKVPESFGSSSQKTKLENPNGKLEFIHGSKMFLSESNIRVKPKIGNFYIFPHYMMHNVYPFKSDGERRSISFNADIDEDIFNVFSN